MRAKVRHDSKVTAMNDDVWPALPYEAWHDTYATLHMWSQIVGKVAVALAPPINHSWGISLHVTARGLATRNLPHGDRSFGMEFDFIAHQLVIRTTDGDARSLPLKARSVAHFYGEFMDTLQAMGLPVKISSMPVEIPAPIRFENDTMHHAYDPEFAHRFWRDSSSGRTGIHRVSLSVHRQVQPGPVLLGQLRPRGVTLLRQAGTPARGPGLDARGLFARSDQPRLLAR